MTYYEGDGRFCVFVLVDEGVRSRVTICFLCISTQIHFPSPNVFPFLVSSNDVLCFKGKKDEEEGNKKRRAKLSEVA
jgi:hypothetical protein